MADLDIHIRASPTLFRWGLVGLFLSAFAAELGSESVTLSTYYPAPSGVYTQMITTGNTYLARDQGNVGVGTKSPQGLAPNGIAQGNLDVNDVYLRSLGQWASQSTSLSSHFVSQTFYYNDCTTICCPAGYIMVGAGGRTNGTQNLNLLPVPLGASPFSCMYFKEGTGCKEHGWGWITCVR